MGDLRCSDRPVKLHLLNWRRRRGGGGGGFMEKANEKSP